MSRWVLTEQFKIVVEHTPLISIDLVKICKDKVPLSCRINKSAKSYYFTTGGIVRKNEFFKEAQKRIAKDKLNLELNSDLKFI